MEPPFILTSVGYSSFQESLLALDEVPADGIYSLVLGSNGMSMITKHPWIQSTVNEQGGSSDISLGMVSMSVERISRQAIRQQYSHFYLDLWFSHYHSGWLTIVFQQTTSYLNRFQKM